MSPSDNQAGRLLHAEPAPAETGQPTPADTVIIIPTYNEGGNVPLLVSRLSSAFSGRAVEILFVDDSTDDTPHVIQHTARTSSIPVRMIHRTRDERAGGLAGAVTTGIRNSRSTYVLVMDGDLQHPPEMAPLVRDAAAGADLAVASRYTAEGDAQGLSSAYRHLISSSSTTLAKACFPRRVGKVCTDPMTGFFCFRRDAVDLTRLRPRGFKILLEILSRHDLDVVELPFAFGTRHSGESKADWRNGVHFCYQMLSLRMGRMSRFAAVGLLGTIVNLALMALLIQVHGLHYLLAAVIAAEVSILFNFTMQERFVFRDMTDGVHSRAKRIASSLIYNNTEVLIRLPILAFLVKVTGIDAVLIQASMLALAFVARFLFMSRVVYRTTRPWWGVRLPAPAEVALLEELNAA
ncbi:MAG: Dolichol-phosphate mannosyltransferase [Blastococcus sp.]|nr:Dolichol-phosphate mannosyltransferase [Blastococcus sp.]